AALLVRQPSSFSHKRIVSFFVPYGGFRTVSRKYFRLRGQDQQFFLDGTDQGGIVHSRQIRPADRPGEEGITRNENPFILQVKGDAPWRMARRMDHLDG